MPNKHEGHIPIEDLPYWEEEFRSIGMRPQTKDALIRHHYYESVRAAIREGLSREEFIAQLIQNITNTYPKVLKKDIQETRVIISKIWELMLDEKNN